MLVYKCTSSTNDIAAEYASNKDNDGLVVFAEEQTAGRGRARRKWFSGPGDSILCSILLTRYEGGGELLSLASAVAVAEAVADVSGADAKIKWPNDVRLNSKKVAGILLESVRVGGRTAYIVGMGINCHQSRLCFPRQLRSTATSIDIETGATVDRTALAGQLLTRFEHWYNRARKTPGDVIGRWQEMSILFHHRVELVYNGRRFRGTCIGTDPDRGLVVQLDGGAVRMFDAAHTTII